MSIGVCTYITKSYILLFNIEINLAHNTLVRLSNSFWYFWDNIWISFFNQPKKKHILCNIETTVLIVQYFFTTKNANKDYMIYFPSCNIVT